MASIVAVHGIGQQFRGDAIIHSEWWPALLSGLHLAGHDLEDKGELVCPFYGHLFRKPGTLAVTEIYQPKDIMAADELVLLELLWQAAAASEPEKVPSQKDYESGESLGRTPQVVQRALNALSKSSFFANISQSFMIGDLKQVVRYLNEPETHEAILKNILHRITDDTRVVIGHSLGSVIAYEALCQKSSNVVSFISLGSPLGIRNLIFDKLTPRPNSMGIGAWPGKVKYWTNIADKGDIVALEKKIASLFEVSVNGSVKDILVHNGSGAHDGDRYLTTIEVGGAIRVGLCS
jgi:hypothetical protein